MLGSFLGFLKLKGPRRVPIGVCIQILLLMMQILHYLKDPKLRALWYIQDMFLIMGNAGFISSAVTNVFFF